MIAKFVDEIIHNMTAYFLVIAAVSVIWLGAHFNIDKEVELGVALGSAALIAFKTPTQEQKTTLQTNPTQVTTETK